MKSKKTQCMFIMVMFLAIQIVLVVIPLDYLPVGPISATTMRTPAIIAGIALGKEAGTQLGFVFGLTSVLSTTSRPTLTPFCFSPFVAIGGNRMSLLIVFVPRILLGYLAGFIYEKLRRKGINENVGIIAGALTGAITNTALVLDGIYLFSGSAYAGAIKVAYDTLIAVLLGVMAINGIAEAILGAAAVLLVCKVIRPITRKFN